MLRQLAYRLHTNFCCTGRKVPHRDRRFAHGAGQAKRSRRREEAHQSIRFPKTAPRPIASGKTTERGLRPKPIDATSRRVWMTWCASRPSCLGEIHRAERRATNPCRAGLAFWKSRSVISLQAVPFVAGSCASPDCVWQKPLPGNQRKQGYPLLPIFTIPSHLSSI